MSPALTARERQTVDLLVSARTGVVRSLEPWRSNPDEPTLPVFYVAHLADAHLRSHGDAASVANGHIGVGKGTDEAGAIRRALGEAVERYCCTQLDPSTMLLATEADLGSSAVTPSECVLYSDSQYRHGDIRYRPHDPHQPIRWVPARSLRDEEWFVPASLTYLCVNGELADETWCYNTSNGVAAGPDPAMARLGGLLELIERDAYLITWMHRLPAARVDLAPLDGLAAHVVSHYAARRIEVHAFDVSVDIAVPVMMAVAVDRSGNGPAAVVGLGCDLDPGITLDKALLELCQGRMGETWRYRHDGSSTRIREPTDVGAIRDHDRAVLPPLDARRARVPPRHAAHDDPRRATERRDRRPGAGPGPVRRAARGGGEQGGVRRHHDAGRGGGEPLGGPDDRNRAPTDPLRVPHRAPRWPAVVRGPVPSRHRSAD